MARRRNAVIGVIGLTAIAAAGVAGIGWFSMAASYSAAHSPRLSEMSDARRDELAREWRSRRSSRRVRQRLMAESLGGAMSYLTSFGEVVSWHMANRIWLPVLILLAEIGVIGGGIALRRLERRLNRPPPR